ncbi:MAG: acetolactate synthase small subunit [Coriobacteriia bacterium]|nr:acetolactate synthase small subunit [Coriobacteriia bacterium]
MQHTISVLVENKPGVLTRVTSLFARRGFNIDSLAVGETEDPSISRITVVTGAESVPLEQITKQVYKLINVIKVTTLTPHDSISRELAMFKVICPPERRHEVFAIVNVFEAKVVDVSKDSVMVEATGTTDKLESLEDIFKGYGIKEMARTGVIALSRGSKEK